MNLTTLVSSLSIMDEHDVVSGMRAMRMQEVSTYHCGDYRITESARKNVIGADKSLVADSCRLQMTNWYFQVQEMCKFSPETIAIALSYMDRYAFNEIMARKSQMARTEYQLSAMTSLYLAVKLNEQRVLSPKTLSYVSQGIITEEQVLKKEVAILESLKWRVNPPTALAFLRHFFALLPSHHKNQAVFDFACFQAELAMHEGDFITTPTSTIAYACIANAFSLRREPWHREFLCKVAKAISIDKDAQQLRRTRKTLYKAITTNERGLDHLNNLSTNKQSVSPFKTTEQRRNYISHVSPRSVLS